MVLRSDAGDTGGVTRTSHLTIDLPDADATRALGRALAALLRAGDLVMLTGDLGAGKTTLTQGIGAGLDVRGQVASPTFVIARVHPPLGDGPALVHVDAYRLGSLDEVDALDLDASLDESVTVVEWGRGLVESIARDRLELTLSRPRDAGRARRDPRRRRVRHAPPHRRGLRRAVGRARAPGCRGRRRCEPGLRGSHRPPRVSRLRSWQF